MTPSKLLTNPQSTCILISRLDSDELRQQQAIYKKWLDKDEVTRLNQIRPEKDKLRFITGRAIIKSVIAELMQVSPESVSLHIDRFGKPLLNTNSNLSFNISHSGNYIVAIFTEGFTSGIDIQSRDLNTGFEDIMKQSFSEQEIDNLKLDSSSVNDRFYNSWTIKEAFAKAHGIGMHMNFKKLEVLYKENTQQQANLHAFDLNIPFPFISGQCQWMIKSFQMINAIMSIAINHRDQKIPELHFYNFIPESTLTPIEPAPYGIGKSVMKPL